MNGGDDRTRVDGFIPGNVAIHGGEGADFLALGCPVVGGDVLMPGGAGAAASAPAFLFLAAAAVAAVFAAFALAPARRARGRRKRRRAGD